MGSLGNPQAWVPYDNRKDCSQGFCSLYCPQWCYLFPPPPPFGFPDDDSSPSFSPLVIAIIGILGSAFLLVCYYTLLSKYCGDLDSLRRRRRHDPSEEFEANHNQMHSESWQAPPTGLDETLIKSIGACKYKKGDGLVQGSECSVCLGEFHEDENLRLLPKCNHSFHLSCIDTWLRSHSNCPLCRCNIVSISPLPIQIPPPVLENPSDNRHYTVFEVEISGRSSGEGTSNAGATVPKTPSQGLSSPRDLEERDTIIEISEDRVQQIRRSVSMDSSFQGHVSIADILSMDQDDDLHMDDHQFPMSVESSKEHRVEHSKSNNRNRVLHCVTGHTVMKRSFSSGRFLFTRHEKGRNSAGEIDFCKCIKEDNTVE